ncbi:phosphate ABC transporter substrate-binding protein PstS [Gordonia aurantiaca]|uniref:phosphate ABC transporter substrate-binding protein PstS n=1 Tax=Gordonia sp. B21 TaxID=3151852 RepID=UPI003266586B
MNIKRNGVLAAVSGLAVLTLVTACGGGGTPTVSGEGSTAQQKAMEHFSQILSDDNDIVLDYTGSGSGDGIKKFIVGDVDFAGSDSALKADEVARARERCNGNDPWHLPLVVGPVAIAYNVEGVDKLQLDPGVIAKIFDGKITTWNDPAIAALNPGVDLPADDIVPVYRSDSSGTTDNFQRFLASAAPADWTHGHSKEFARPQVGSGATKSTGVGDTVKKTPGSITYVEWGFATENGLGVADIDFGAGPVALDAASAGKALDALEFENPDSKDLVVDTDALFASKTPGAYPLLLTPYSIVCSAGYDDAETATTLKDAFTAILNEGQNGLEELGYVPVPAGFKAKLQTSIDALAGSGNA